MIKDNLKGLNEEQRQGVTHNHGPLLILAGAGSGKTRVITTRISFLIRKLSVSPSNILALTFTNKSGKEMKERVIKMLSGRSTKGLWVGTFHGFCVKILKENIHLLGYRKSFSIFNSSDKIHLIGTILKEMKISEDNLSVDQASWKISDAKNQLLHPDESHKIFDDKVLIDVYKKYQETLKG
ncbi:MAG: UvrD-helicase domain-containing protein, partial [Spirochaetes bacterium]|nr:UvrD-helicase domain-containing protein [Spirochaetota bacterium]